MWDMTQTYVPTYVYLCYVPVYVGTYTRAYLDVPTYLYTPKYGHVPNIDFPCYPLEKEAEATNKLDSGYPAPTHLTTQPKSLAPLPLTPPIHPPSHPHGDFFPLPHGEKKVRGGGLYAIVNPLPSWRRQLVLLLR